MPPKVLTYRTCCCVLYNRIFLNSGGLIASKGSYLQSLLLCLVQPALNSGGLVLPKDLTYRTFCCVLYNRLIA